MWKLPDWVQLIGPAVILVGLAVIEIGAAKAHFRKHRDDYTLAGSLLVCIGLITLFTLAYAIRNQ